MLSINNIYWKVRFVPPSYPFLRRITGEFALAACDNSTKTIYINNTIHGKLLKKVLCHEITHAAMFSYNVNLTVEQEQLVADTIATYGQEIIYATNKIFKQIK